MSTPDQNLDRDARHDDADHDSPSRSGGVRGAINDLLGRDDHSGESRTDTRTDDSHLTGDRAADSYDNESRVTDSHVTDDRTVGSLDTDSRLDGDRTGGSFDTDSNVGGDRTGGSFDTDSRADGDRTAGSFDNSNRTSDRTGGSYDTDSRADGDLTGGSYESTPAGQDRVGAADDRPGQAFDGPAAGDAGYRGDPTPGAGAYDGEQAGGTRHDDAVSAGDRDRSDGSVGTRTPDLDAADTGPVAVTGAGAAGSTGGTTHVADTAKGQDAEGRERLVSAERADSYSSRWDAVKGEFVDEPRKAVVDADTLVGELLDELQTLFTEQRQGIERSLDADETSTEDMRLALRRYRSFFDRLLSI